MATKKKATPKKKVAPRGKKVEPLNALIVQVEGKKCKIHVGGDSEVIISALCESYERVPAFREFLEKLVLRLLHTGAETNKREKSKSIPKKSTQKKKK